MASATDLVVHMLKTRGGVTVEDMSELPDRWVDRQPRALSISPPTVLEVGFFGTLQPFVGQRFAVLDP